MKKIKKSVIDPAVSQAAAALGSQGGRNGTGKSKKRSSDHYTVTLPEARRQARLKAKLNP